MYTTKEFRQSIRKAFNDAEEGHEVVITRFGRQFQLVSLVDLPLGGRHFESTPSSVKPIHPLTPEFKPVPEKSPSGLTYEPFID